MANGFQGAPAVDFYSMLSGLGDTIAKNRADSAKKDAYAAAMTPGPDGKVDFGKAIMGLAQVDPHAASVLSSVQAHKDSVAQADRTYNHTIGREKIEDDWSDTTRADSLKQHAESMAIQRQTADRLANPTPSGYRRNAAGGLDYIAGGPEDPTTVAAQAKAKEGATGGPKYGVSPVFGSRKGPDGVDRPSAVQFSTNGTVVEPQLPEGFNIARDPIKIDNGTHWTLLDPQTRQIIGTQPKNLAAAEKEKVVGDAAGTAEVGLPQALATANQTLKTIEDLKAHPGLDHSVGLWSGVPNIPGSNGADFAAKAAQLKGQTFLQAYQTLRGSGAITDIEGKKGEDAIAALERTQSKEQYIKSLNELKTVIMGGMMRARAKASMGQPAVPDSAVSGGEPTVSSKPVKVGGYTITEH